MTKPVSRKMAVDCLLWRIGQPGLTMVVVDPDNPDRICAAFKCTECGDPILPGQTIQFDHTHADKRGGGHTFRDIRPIHYDPCHKRKSKRDVAALAKIDRITGKTKNGPKRKIPSPNKPWPKRPMRKK